MRNTTSFALCIIGGLMLLMVNYFGAMWDLLFGLYLIVHGIPALSAIWLIIDIILLVLWIISWLGGIAIIIGGYLMTTRRVGTGKFIVGIAAGFGLISLIILIIQVVLVFGLPGIIGMFVVLANSMLAMGLVLTIIARSIAENPR
ncbi:MAG: hypothetical protein ACTSV2_14725 [Candidatus Thorarchaeota archaeon]